MESYNPKYDQTGEWYKSVQTPYIRGGGGVGGSCDNRMGNLAIGFKALFDKTIHIHEEEKSNLIGQVRDLTIKLENLMNEQKETKECEMRASMLTLKISELERKANECAKDDRVLELMNMVELLQSKILSLNEGNKEQVNNIIINLQNEIKANILALKNAEDKHKELAKAEGELIELRIKYELLLKQGENTGELGKTILILEERIREYERELVVLRSASSELLEVRKQLELCREGSKKAEELQRRLDEAIRRIAELESKKREEEDENKKPAIIELPAVKEEQIAEREKEVLQKSDYLLDDDELLVKVGAEILPNGQKDSGLLRRSIAFLWFLASNKLSYTVKHRVNWTNEDFVRFYVENGKFPFRQTNLVTPARTEKVGSFTKEIPAVTTETWSDVSCNLFAISEPMAYSRGQTLSVRTYADIFSRNMSRESNKIMETLNHDGIPTTLIGDEDSDRGVIINRSYALFMLRNRRKLNEENMFGLDPYIYFRTTPDRTDYVSLLLSYLALQASRYRKVGLWFGEMGEKVLANVSENRADQVVLSLGVHTEGYEADAKVETDYDKLKVGKSVKKKNNVFHCTEVWDALYSYYIISGNYEINDKVLERYDYTPSSQLIAYIKTSWPALNADLVSKKKIATVYDRTNDYFMWRGTAPFCNGQMGECEAIDGGFFKSERVASGANDGKFGASCWTGKKVKCVLSRTALAKSGALAGYDIDLNETEFQFKWFGTAPFCDADICDLFTLNYLPIAFDKSGDGHECKTGQKILGARPSGNYGYQSLPEYNSMKFECAKLMAAKEADKWAILKNITEMAKDILGAALAA